MHARDESRARDDAVARRAPLSGPAADTATRPAHALLSLQSRAGNANVARMLGAEGRPAPAVQRAPVVQRNKLLNGNISFTNVSLKYPESQDKATRVLQLLSANTAIKSFLNNRSCRITLEKRTSQAPADVVDKGADGVFVTMAAYYLENYDIGYIVGMLCHEFGIHPMAAAAPHTRDEEEAFRGVPFPVPGLEHKPHPDGFASMNTDAAKQADHVLGVIPGSPRYTIYRNVTLEMADLLLRDARNKAPGAREQDVTDLLDCFLMDVASIAATNDNRLRGMPLLGNNEGPAIRQDIASVYNAYKSRLADDLSEERQPIKPLFPPEKTPEAVKADFNTLLGRITKGAFRAWSIDNSD
ncbi:hypothetical protein [Streptomyces sp. MBT53]|uniref:hypothetical protein n=1 Tax=Streptomyces sp. MBT53 TaxID=1488384 RepID=UPI0019120520|nr:hypothetical protein [Streptomyces sp. MBT53]MBK6017397.1 hypothetical protein [Streptomyces sp. MBT53]